MNITKLRNILRSNVETNIAKSRLASSVMHKANKYAEVYDALDHLTDEQLLEVLQTLRQLLENG